MKVLTVLRRLSSLPLLSIPLLVSGTPANWISVRSDNRLVYAADARGNRIPDFSNCGYEGGGVSIPLIPVKMEVNPAPGDAGDRIQAAIDAVSRLPMDAGGFRGAVLLHKGTYPVAGELHIAADGVVLRGEGQGDGATLLLATGKIKRSLIILDPSGHSPATHDDDETEAPAIDAAATEASASLPITDGCVPVGAYSFHVRDASAVRVGQMVIVFRPSTANWIHDLGMDRIPQNKEGSIKEWTAGSKDLAFRRPVTAVAANLVTVEAPICCALDANYGGGKLIIGYQPASIRHCGVEDLRGDSEYHGPTDEAHGWTLVDIAAARDSWAGANQVLWNCKAESIIVEQPPTAQNWAIGCIAKTLKGNGYFESKGRQVFPRSLYRAQLTERLGSAAANAILGAGS